MYGTGSVPNEDARTAHSRDKVRAVHAHQKRGRMDATIDPRDLVMLVIALATATDAMPQLARMIEAGDPRAPRARARRRAESEALSLHGFTADDPPGAALRATGSTRLGLNVLDELVGLEPTRDGGLLATPAARRLRGGAAR